MYKDQSGHFLRHKCPRKVSISSKTGVLELLSELTTNFGDGMQKSTPHYPM